MVNRFTFRPKIGEMKTLTMESDRPMNVQYHKQQSQILFCDVIIRSDSGIPWRSSSIVFKVILIVIKLNGAGDGPSK